MDLVEDGASERRLADHISHLRAELTALDVVPYGLDIVLDRVPVPRLDPAQLRTQARDGRSDR